MKPTVKFLLSHPFHFLSLGFGSGLLPKMPGTWGTLVALIIYILLSPIILTNFSFVAILITLILLGILGIFCIKKTGEALGDVDHSSIVWDEMVPFWTLLFYIPQRLELFLAAFVLFRLFDITKPQPAKYFDQKVKNSFGVMMDDYVAAIYAALGIFLINHFI